MAVASLSTRTPSSRGSRRGTRVRFRPDPQIFSEDARFQPRRLFKMARSKAYLFGGVEIRWRCAHALLDGAEKVPAEASFRFPGGLKDYLAREIEGRELVAEPVFAGKVVKPGGHGSLEWAVAWLADADGFSSSYCNTIPTPEGGTHENGFRIALLRGLRDHAVRVHPRAGIPGPDQGQARDAGGVPHRRGDGPRRLRPLARRLAAPGAPADRVGGGARRRAP